MDLSDTHSGYENCWNYPTPHPTLGYGMASVGGRNGKTVYVHRAVYEVLVGPIPPGYQVDHLCRNRACYNPAHLEAVTPQENNRRAGVYRRKKACAFGHALIDLGTQRRCVTCRQSYLRRWYLARKVQAG